MAGVNVSVVAGKDDEGIVFQARLAQPIKNATDLSIHLLGEPMVDPSVDTPVAVIILLAHSDGGSDRFRVQVGLDCRRFILGNGKVPRQWRQFAVRQSSGLSVQREHVMCVNAVLCPGREADVTFLVYENGLAKRQASPGWTRDYGPIYWVGIGPPPAYLYGHWPLEQTCHFQLDTVSSLTAAMLNESSQNEP